MIQFTRLSVFGIVTLLVLLGCGEQVRIQQAPPAAATQAEPVIIVAFGDSLTRGAGVNESEAYPAVLEQMLRAQGQQHKVINMGQNGDTSARALARIDSVLAQEPDIVILEIGINDGLQGARVEEIAGNITTIIDRLQERNITVLLAGIPEENLPPTAYGAEFGSMLQGIARERQVTMVPLLDGVLANPALIQDDYAHPTAAGHQVMAQNVYAYVQAALAQPAK